MVSLSIRLLRVALLVGLLALPAHLASAQDRVRESRSVDSFTELEYALPGTLHLRQGDPQSVEIDAPQAVLDKIETTVDGESLEISDGNKSGFFDRFFGDGGLDTDDIDVYVTAPTINAVSLAGSGRVVGETRIRGASLSLTVAGSGDLKMDLDTEDLSVRVAGSGTSTLQGEATTLDVNIAGSGDLRAADLATQQADVRIAGSGDAELNVADRLTAEIIGSGNVRYRGRPTVDTTTLGSGAVRSMNGGP